MHTSQETNYISENSVQACNIVLDREQLENHGLKFLASHAFLLATMQYNKDYRTLHFTFKKPLIKIGSLTSLPDNILQFLLIPLLSCSSKSPDKLS